MGGSSSSEFQDSSQTPSVMVLMKLVVCTRSSFEHQSFSEKRGSLGASAVCVLPRHIKGRDRTTCSGILWACVTWTVDCFLVIKDRIAEHVLGLCGPVSHGQSTASLS